MTTAHRIDNPSRTHDWHGTHLLVVYGNGLPDLGVFAVLARGGGRGGAGVPRCESEARRDDASCSTPESLADTGHGPSSASKQRQQSKRHAREGVQTRFSLNSRRHSRHSRLALPPPAFPPWRTKPRGDLCLDGPGANSGRRGGRGRKAEKNRGQRTETKCAIKGSLPV